MTREQVKELLPIIQAFAEGKMIQDKIEGLTDWVDTDEINLEYEGQAIKHRIKPEPKYRPFKDKAECWQEMQKHQPFGWIKGSVTDEYKQIVRVFGYGEVDLIFNIAYNSSMDYTSGMMFDSYTFTDGTPFGIKEK